jgi:hypothetical protein
MVQVAAKPVWWNGQPAVSPSTQDKAFYFPTIGKGKPAQKSENKRDIIYHLGENGTLNS